MERIHVMKYRILWKVTTIANAGKGVQREGGERAARHLPRRARPPWQLPHCQSLKRRVQGNHQIEVVLYLKQNQFFMWRFSIWRWRATTSATCPRCVLLILKEDQTWISRTVGVCVLHCKMWFLLTSNEGCNWRCQGRSRGWQPKGLSGKIKAPPRFPFADNSALQYCFQDAFEISKSKMQPTHPIR